MKRAVGICSAPASNWLAAHWTAKMEYLYLDYGSNNNAWVFAGLPTINDNSRVYENLVRAV
jgi:hypothetical protein